MNPASLRIWPNQKNALSLCIFPLCVHTFLAFYPLLEVKREPQKRHKHQRARDVFF